MGGRSVQGLDVREKHRLDATARHESGAFQDGVNISVEAARAGAGQPGDGRGGNGQQQQPIQIRVAEPPPPVWAPFDAVEQTEALIPAQSGLRHSAFVCGLSDGPVRHAPNRRC